MISKVKVLLHVHHIERVFLVQVLQVLQNVDLDHALLLKALLAPYDLHRHVLLLLVVEALEHLAEAALAQCLDDLVAVGDVVLVGLQVRAVLVVIVLGARGTYLLGVQAQEPDLGVLVDLLSLELGQLVAVQLQGFYFLYYNSFETLNVELDVFAYFQWIRKF